MVGVAQLVEHRVVVPVAAGSNPVAHPKFNCAPLAQLDRAPDFETSGWILRNPAKAGKAFVVGASPLTFERPKGIEHA